MVKKANSNRRTRLRTRGQAIVETAMLSVFLGLLLAGSLDFGRAYFTAVVVTNMAAEGAAYASLNPDYDLNYAAAGACSQRGVASYANIQDRVRLVAKEHGLVIKQGDRDAVVTTVSTTGYDSTCASRCLGRTIQVKVTYKLSDLFLPNLLGMRSITISKSATQQIQRDAYAGVCP